MCELVVTWKKLDRKMKQKGAFLAWCIWTERNQKVFENKTTPNTVIVERVYRLVYDHRKYACRI